MSCGMYSFSLRRAMDTVHINVFVVGMDGGDLLHLGQRGSRVSQSSVTLPCMTTCTHHHTFTPVPPRPRLISSQACYRLFNSIRVPSVSETRLRKKKKIDHVTQHHRLRLRVCNLAVVATFWGRKHVHHIRPLSAHNVCTARKKNNQSTRMSCTGLKFPFPCASQPVG